MMHPEHGLHTESLLRLGHVPDMACTSCPQKAYKCLKIKMHPYRGQEASLSWPWGVSDMAYTLRCVPTMVRTRPGRGQHTVPKNFPRMSEYQAVTRMWPG
ncbi:Hypothetical predicted protein [Olea europaea subsp. europaea]|uniref:Uncharacterized protein n=1 Tax=Olea europaea subsp. europaea TaxID=158383 RepID=A0A8S0TZM7_OLEEU|nr:Hypothetical predicted protein [Olea europaea subsp. europaea]